MPVARPKQMASKNKGSSKRKDEGTSTNDDTSSPVKKKQKKNGSSSDIDESVVNVDEMLEKILRERKKRDSATGELIFTAKELTAIGADNLTYLSSCYPLGLSMIVQVPVTKILPPTPLYGCRPFNETHMWDILLSLRTKIAVIPQVADLLLVRLQKSTDEKGTVREVKLRFQTQEDLRDAPH
ncbi:hypothetical protein R1sor_026026 [Riccia sorocarpa]|uniref:Uncharacterized protein n=1 Tax=Riccia sorocarpa TaxID=122646 RepID=A0ABD3GA84_9MARC